MSPSIFRTALAAAVAASLAAAPSALARKPVFGGATRDDQAIVLRTDGKAKKLKSAVIAWSAACKGGGYWADGGAVTASSAQPGFTPDPRELIVSRNKRGRFSGTQLVSSISGDLSAGIVVDLAGKLSRRRASGTLSAHVTLLDQAGNIVDGCDTGVVKWTASRSLARIYGGKTSQDLPVVVRLDRARRNVSDLMIGWGSRECVPDGFLSYGESFRGFALKGGRFGDAFSQDYSLDDGSTRTFAYDVAGKVARSIARGSFSVTIDERDPAGAQTLSCDTGPVSWSAASG